MSSKREDSEAFSYGTARDTESSLHMSTNDLNALRSEETQPLFAIAEDNDTANDSDATADFVEEEEEGEGDELPSSPPPSSAPKSGSGGSIICVVSRFLCVCMYMCMGMYEIIAS